MPVSAQLVEYPTITRRLNKIDGAARDALLHRHRSPTHQRHELVRKHKSLPVHLDPITLPARKSDQATCLVHAESHCMQAAVGYLAACDFEFH